LTIWARAAGTKARAAVMEKMKRGGRNMAARSIGQTPGMSACMRFLIVVGSLAVIASIITLPAPALSATLPASADRSEGTWGRRGFAEGLPSPTEKWGHPGFPWVCVEGTG
jgi:hypothetical protein